jgi:hypothetical protein
MPRMVFSQLNSLDIRVKNKSHLRPECYGKLNNLIHIRHREIDLCAVSALAFHLLDRFHVQKEKRPDFSSRSHWYNRMILKGHGHQAILKAFEAFKVNCI